MPLVSISDEHAGRSRGPTGRRPFTTGCPETCTLFARGRANIWPSSAGSLPRSGWTVRSRSPADRAGTQGRRQDLPRRTCYYAQTIEPLLHESRSFVEFIGEVGGQEKDEFLGNAYAFLFPIDWPEPFGLVMIEAMACGTPVIAWRHGSVPEVITDGVTGFVVESIEQAVDAVDRVVALDRRDCRISFEQRFDAARMARDYLDVYRHSLRGEPVLAEAAIHPFVPAGPISEGRPKVATKFRRPRAPLLGAMPRAR